MPNVYAEFDDGYWRVVDSNGRRWAFTEIGNFKQIGGHFVDYHDVTDYGWDEGTRVPGEHTAQLIAGALQLWVDEVAAKERATERRASSNATIDELAAVIGECYGESPPSTAAKLLSRFTITKKTM